MARAVSASIHRRSELSFANNVSAPKVLSFHRGNENPNAQKLTIPGNNVTQGLFILSEAVLTQVKRLLMCWQ
jgi:hypothetical protein